MKLLNNSNDSLDDDASFLQHVEFFIIFRATTLEFVEGYEQIRQTYDKVDNPVKLCFLCEGERIGCAALDAPSIPDNMEDNAFSYLLEYAVNTSTPDADHARRTPSFVMFLTDDCVFLESLDIVLAHAIGSLQYKQKDRVFNFLTRLHPGISRSQTRDCISPSPRDWQYHSLVPYLNNVFDTDAHASAKRNDGVYLYTTKSGSIEWNYPFDLSGGVYRHNDVQMILKQIRTEDECINQDGLAHPNTLEVRGNKAVLALNEKFVQNRKTLSAIPSRPLMVILAVNRVQDICRAPIAGSGEGRVTIGTITNEESDSIDPTNLSALLKLLQNGHHLDLRRYLLTPYNSSHIGDVFLCDQHNGLQSSVAQGPFPDVSVLIPVHSGVNFASHSITSIIMQYVDELRKPLDNEATGTQSSLSSMQIVIVDDRCADGSIDVMIQSCKTLLDSQPEVSLVVLDHRLEDTILDQEQKPKQHLQTKFSIAIDVISSKSPGVASALNTGLKHCRSELVARMDADDVSAPHRLITQLRFLRANPSINVVGASAVIFSSEADESKSGCTLLPHHAHIVRTSLTLLDPGFMAWAMLFTCNLAHPTVMFRKSAIEVIGGYDESIKCTEDYDLWLRLSDKDCRSILCLPFVGVWHRKHNRSNSVTNSSAQKKEANEACYRAIKQILHEGNNDEELFDLDHVSMLKDPTVASSLVSINDVARLLVNIESSFLHRHARYLSGHEIELIQHDCNARIGELATIAISKFGENNPNQFKFNSNEGPCYVWKLWSDRLPNEQFQRLSLLCHLATTS
jgi:glycosyltransferase involved in cell wall biosynthesis